MLQVLSAISIAFVGLEILLSLLTIITFAKAATLTLTLTLTLTHHHHLRQGAAP